MADEQPVTLEEVVRRGMASGGRRLISFAVDLVTGAVSFVFETDTAQADPKPTAKADPFAGMPDLAREIYQVLLEVELAAETEHDLWIPGKELAERISEDIDPAGGGFLRAVAALRKAGILKSARSGYKLIRRI